MFWGVGGLQIRIDLLCNLGSKQAHGKLGDFLGCVGSQSAKTLEDMSILGCTCVRMEAFVLLAFFPSFVAFFAKFDIFPLKVVFLECRKGHDGGKRTNGEFGQDP